MGGLGVAMVLRPEYVVARSRDDDEADRPITSWDLTKTRILGVVIFAMAAFFVEAVLTGRPGAEFFPV